MTPTSPAEPFQREQVIDKPGIVGAQWWQRSLESAGDPVSRRQALVGLVAVAGVIGMVGVVGAIAASASSPSSDDYRTENRSALDMQKEYGWSFGANAEPLTFDGTAQRPFDRDAVLHLADDLRPRAAARVPWYEPTLFLSLTAVRRTTPQEETTPPSPLAQVIQPIFTPAMDTAYRRGKALASLIAPLSSLSLIIVDLPGPEAVAFAAGAAGALDPIFAFDNWPHPRGVVPAHLTLAAAAYYQPLLAKHTASSASPLLVLDRARLNAYGDDSSQFDNRYVARMPSAAALKALGVRQAIYVPPFSGDQELDDLNDDLVLYTAAGLPLRLLGASALPYDDSSQGAVLPGLPYTPVPRATPFSSGAPGGSLNKPRPSGFGTVPVMIAVATGLVLGAKLLRSGSWNRSGSTSWGG
jgi:hypothetical protein